MKIEVRCSHCNKVLYKKPSVVAKNKSGKFYCDRVCRGNDERKIYKFNCKECGKYFERLGGKLHNSTNYFCSVACSCRYGNKSRIKRNEYVCDYCNAIYYRQPSKVRGNNKYCSKKCKDSHHHIYVQGEKSYRWNPNLSDEDRLRLRKSPEYSKWRNDVISRDDKKCLKCGVNENLVAHHIINHLENLDKSLDVDNGLTLCNDCHISFHSRYKNKNNNINQIKEFLKDSR